MALNGQAILSSLSHQATVIYQSLLRRAADLATSGPWVSLDTSQWMAIATSAGLVALLLYLYRNPSIPAHWLRWVGLLAIVRLLLWRVIHFPESAGLRGFLWSLGLYGLELGFFAGLILLGWFFAVSRPNGNGQSTVMPVAPTEWPGVTVIVLVGQESVSEVNRSLLAIQAIDYPDFRLHVVDLSNRLDIRDLAGNLNIPYAGQRNVQESAGFLVNAIVSESSDYWLLMLEASQAPTRHCLKQMMSAMLADPSLGFVQAETSVLGADPLLRNLLLVEHGTSEPIWHQQSLSRASHGLGSLGQGSLIRREALESTNGLVPDEAVPFIRSSLNILVQGWRSKTIHGAQLSAMAPESLEDLLERRMALMQSWARAVGSFANPLLKPGLSRTERLVALTLGHWQYVLALFMGVWLLWPVLGSLAANAAFQGRGLSSAVYTIPALLAGFLLVALWSGNQLHGLWLVLYQTLFSPYAWLAATLSILPSGLLDRLGIRNGKALKLLGNIRRQLIMVNASLVALALVSVAWLAFVNWQSRSIQFSSVWMALWLSVVAILALTIIWGARERTSVRQSPRVVRRIRAEARLMDGSLAVGYTSDISETGLSLTFEEPVPLAGTIAVRLLDWPAGQISIFQAQVVQSTVDESNKHHVGLKLVNRTPEQHSRLIRHMYGGASLLPLPPSASTWSILKQWMGTPFRQSSMQRRAGRRRCPRFPLSLACVLDASGVFSIGFTNEISENGLKMTLKPNARLFVGDDVRVYIQWNKREITDWPAQLVRIEPTSEHEYQLGIQFNGLSRKERLVLIRHLYNQCDRMVRVAPAVSRAVDCILTLPSGQMARGVTVEMSEMGLVVGIQGVLTVRDGEAVSIQLYWSDRTTSTYTGLVKSTFDPSQYGLHSPPLALIYFDAMSLHVMDDLSRRIEMDMPNGEALPFGVLKD